MGFVILPIIAFVSIFLLTYQSNKCWRSSFLDSSVIWGIVIVIITELLSSIKLINLITLLIAWLLVNCALASRLLKTNSLKFLLDNLKLKNFQINHFLFLILITLIITAIGIQALVAAPNHWDSMSYHMPRVVHWVQNHSVAHYPTNYTPQLYSPPWTEFTIMHLQILSGGDHFANLVQWYGMVGSIIGVSLIAKELGGNLQAQIYTAVICSTIPVGILNASNTNSTYTVTFWLVCLAHYTISAIKHKSYRKEIFFLGLSLGIAIFTKGTAYTYALPFIGWLCLAKIKHKTKLLSCLVIICLIAIIINLGHYYRNFNLFGAPISTHPYKWSPDIYSIPTFLSSVIKNISLHITLPFDVSINDWLELVIIKIHSLIGIDINDPRITMWTKFTIKNNLATFEDTAGNPFHFWLFIATLILFICKPKLRSSILINYIIAVVCSFLLFCLLIKWQIWHSRLHLPIFVLVSPFMGIILSKFNLFSKYSFVKYIMIILLGLSPFWILYNASRPMLGEENIFNTSRIEQYFFIRKPIEKGYVEATNAVNQCQTIGLALHEDSWEYPLWVLLGKGHRLEHIAVNNLSKSLEDKNFQPCGIISIGNKHDEFKNYLKVGEWNSMEKMEAFRETDHSKGS